MPRIDLSEIYLSSGNDGHLKTTTAFALIYSVDDSTRFFARYVLRTKTSFALGNSLLGLFFSLDSAFSSFKWLSYLHAAEV